MCLLLGERGPHNGAPLPLGVGGGQGGLRPAWMCDCPGSPGSSQKGRAGAGAGALHLLLPPSPPRPRGTCAAAVSAVPPHREGGDLPQRPNCGRRGQGGRTASPRCCHTSEGGAVPVLTPGFAGEGFLPGRGVSDTDADEADGLCLGLGAPKSCLGGPFLLQAPREGRAGPGQGLGVDPGLGQKRAALPGTGDRAVEGPQPRPPVFLGVGSPGAGAELSLPWQRAEGSGPGLGWARRGARRSPVLRGTRGGQ